MTTAAVPVTSESTTAAAPVSPARPVGRARVRMPAAVALLVCLASLGWFGVYEWRHRPVLGVLDAPPFKMSDAAWRSILTVATTTESSCPPSVPVVVVYVSASCIHCRAELELLGESRAKRRTSTVVHRPCGRRRAGPINSNSRLAPSRARADAAMGPRRDGRARSRCASRAARGVRDQQRRCNRESCSVRHLKHPPAKGSQTFAESPAHGEELSEMNGRPGGALTRFVDQRAPVFEPLALIALVSLTTTWVIQPFVVHALSQQGAPAQGAAQAALWLSGVLAPFAALAKAIAAALICWSCAVFFGERLPFGKLLRSSALQRPSFCCAT